MHEAVLDMFNSLVAAFIIVVIIGPKLIPFLRKLKIGQTEREEGPESHLKKKGTPTMGGIMIILGMSIATIIFHKRAPQCTPILMLTIGFGLIGFLDDFLKVVMKRSQGLLPWQKMGLQLLVTGGFAFYLYNFTEFDMRMRIPFVPDKMLDIGVFHIPVLFFLVIGVVNATNLTDGLDGLLSGVTLFVTLFFMVAAVYLDVDITPIIGAMAGAILGFLMFNSKPASVFMGDTGSLAIGGFVIGCAYMMQLELFLVIVGFIYVAETLSVMMQVSYFKITKGKRIFKMTPIHHHFELSGYEETKVTWAFIIVTAVLCAVGIIALFETI